MSWLKVCVLLALLISLVRVGPVHYFKWSRWFRNAHTNLFHFFSDFISARLTSRLPVYSVLPVYSSHLLTLVLPTASHWPQGGLEIIYLSYFQKIYDTMDFPFKTFNNNFFPVTLNGILFENIITPECFSHSGV